MKKRSFGEGKWNGVGGKVGDKVQETIEEAAIRETNEEIGVIISDLKKVAELTFNFTNRKDWDQMVHVFFVEKWIGNPTESEEMNPQWFNTKNIPYDKMWTADKMWMPLVLAGKILQGNFDLSTDDVIQKYSISKN